VRFQVRVATALTAKVQGLAADLGGNAALFQKIGAAMRVLNEFRFLLRRFTIVLRTWTRNRSQPGPRNPKNQVSE